ncbi:ArgS-related anticodon-binding protein NrtL [Streptomyces sp. HUAS CX7]|uniref:ArgS-related anticodon-binding protein NrtL n=1 Tax=Streptomyces sp. HUAS CX7 TaxID=3062782 RepID=UPI0026EA9A6C|nr:DALR anticodon-binding domain-containing protein [Streptomyces sp. HUAS CX7]WKX18695.1 DALR anticodon-binding domain-containing protein [Streptomyces sp. HUAS CX7]
MTPVELSRTVLHAVRRAVDAGELSVAVPTRAVVAPPGPGGCGDYATSIALQLARPAGQTPFRVAEVLRPYLVGTDGITDVVLTGPGFLNISFDRAAAGVGLVREILRRGDRYGYADRPGGRVVQLHCPHDLRAVVVAEASARLLRSQGALVRVTAEGFEDVWTSVLGVTVDAVGHAPAELPVNVRPVPVPASEAADVMSLGRDAGRWALLHPAPHDRPRTGDEHLVQRESNPLFRVRYAHARARAATRNAADLGFTADPGPVTCSGSGTPTGPLTGSAPGTPTAPLPGTPTAPTPHADAAPALLAALADHPRVLAAAAEHRAPDRLARHLVVVADAALPFLLTVLPRGGEKPSAAHRARLALAEAVGAVLAGGLDLLGIDAPDHL